MCGIAGVLVLESVPGRVDEGELLRMRDHMRDRGPDGAGCWIEGGGQVGLAHRRLAIIGLGEAGAQPMRDPVSGNQIVFNGEIYNHIVLRHELQRQGVHFQGGSDTEVLLKLYDREGPAMLGKLRGMFAFAIWDTTRRQLFLARDAFGMKPLYVATAGGRFRFASQVKALLTALPQQQPDPAGHAGFMLWGSVPEPFTLYRDIRALPPGHWAVVGGSGMSKPVEFASPLAAFQQGRVAPAANAQQAAQGMANAVADSVAAHMVADVPVGVFLSAGLDSTMLAASAARLGPVRSVTLGFEEYQDSHFDESVLAAQTAGLLMTDHSNHRVQARDFQDDRARLLAAMDQPSIDGINSWFVAKAAAQRGLKVALSGIGGDEIFGTYPSFRQVTALQRRLAPLGGWPRLARATRRGLAPVARWLPSAKYAGILEYGTSLPGAYLLRRALFMPWELPALLGNEMASAGLETLATLQQLQASVQGLEPGVEAVSAMEFQWYLRNQLLRDADWAGMAHSVEIRMPFVDMPVLQSAIALQAARRPEMKRAVAALLAPGLPAEVLRRRKTGFAVPIQQWADPQSKPLSFRHRDWALDVYRPYRA